MVNCETLLGVCEVVSVTKPSWTHKAIETCLVVLSFHRQTTAQQALAQQHLFFTRAYL